jgi:hypothetical protein
VRAFDAQNAGVPLKVMRKIMENVSTAMVVLFIKTPPDIFTSMHDENMSNSYNE